MSKKTLFAIMFSLSATLAAPAAIADISETSTITQDRGAATGGDTDEEATRRLLEQFRAAQLSLSRAMAIAERLHRGSRTVRIGFDVSNSPGYRVRTVKNSEIWENFIDANTGGVKGVEIVSPLQELDGEDQVNIVALKSVRQELSDAVRVAEKATSGAALGGGLLQQDGHFNFVVVIVSGDSLKEVMLEPPRIDRRGSAAHRPR
jgi:uncharacterized membrane protein YkoI